MEVLLRFGYSVDNEHHYVINEQEAVIIRLIFDMYMNNHTYKEICSELNLRGYKTRKSKDFGLNSIHDILANEKYKGTYFFGYGGKAKKRGQPREDMIKKENGMPAIIDEDTFDIVQTKMKRRRYMGGAYKATQVYLLSGLIKCGICGNNYVGTKKNAYWSIYECTGHKKSNCENSSIKKQDIEEKVIKELKSNLENIINNRSILEKVNQKYAELYKNVDIDLSIANQKLATVNSKIDNINKAVIDGLYSPNLKDEMNSLQFQKNELEQEIHMIKSVSSKEKVDIEDINKIIKKDLLELNSDDLETVKKVIHKYVSEIIINPNDINIKIFISDFKDTGGNIARVSSPPRLSPFYYCIEVTIKR